MIDNTNLSGECQGLFMKIKWIRLGMKVSNVLKENSDK